MKIGVIALLTMLLTVSCARRDMDDDRVEDTSRTTTTTTGTTTVD